MTAFFLPVPGFDRIDLINPVLGNFDPGNIGIHEITHLRGLEHHQPRLDGNVELGRFVDECLNNLAVEYRRRLKKFWHTVCFVLRQSKQSIPPF